jgi:hypothetical protein
MLTLLLKVQPDGLACAVQCTGQHKKLTFNLQSGFTQALLYCIALHCRVHQSDTPADIAVDRSKRAALLQGSCVLKCLVGQNWYRLYLGCVAILHSPVGAATSYSSWEWASLPPTC